MFIQNIEHIFGGGTKTSSMLSLALFLCISCLGMHKSFAASAIKVRKQISGFSAYFSDTIYEGYYLPHIMKRVKMKKSSSNKELLIDWLRTALDFQLYPGLGWSNRNEGVFYVKWVHKSSEQWSGDDLAPFRAWASHKGKLDGKNPKQLKATFRCALNSKKELKEHSRDRERRYWQFVDPNTVEKDKVPKKKRKNNKANKPPCVDSEIADAYDREVKNIIDNGLFPLRISSSSQDEISKSTKLPAFDSFSFQPLTPPDQANENLYSRPDLKFSREKIVKLEKFDTSSGDVHHRPSSISPIHVNNSLIGTTKEACTVLPPFEIFGSFRTLTPPPQKNEVFYTEYTPNYTPPPDQNRLTPPQKSFHVSRDLCNQSSTDVWQPNCWPVLNGDKDPRNLSDFFSSDFIGMYKSSTPEPENNHPIDFLDMDQYVPVTNTSINLQIHNRIGQSTLVNRIPPSASVQTDHSLEKLDDFFLGDDVDSEACRKLMQEIERTSSVPQYRLHI